MIAAQLLETLRARGAELWREGDQLRVRAPKGALTPALQARVADLRDALLALLADGAEDAAPFPLTELQEAYLVGRSSAFALGGMACHMIVEVEGEGLDPARVEAAWRALVARHPALRLVLLPEGGQRVLEAPPPWSLPVHDLRDATPEAAEAARLATRRRLQARCDDPTRWPLTTLELTLLPGGRSALHIDHDLLICDAAGAMCWLTELAHLVSDPGAALPPPGTRLRAIALADHLARSSAAAREDEAWWVQRLDAMPPGPPLPLACDPADLVAPPPRHLEARLDPARWARLSARAGAEGLSPSVLVAAAFAEVLAAWSGAGAFTLATTLFREPPALEPGHAQLGEFTTTLLVEADAGPPTFLARALALRDRWTEAMDRSACSGVAARRALLRERGRAPDFPVVFTSILGAGSHGDLNAAVAPLGERVFQASQTPQVWLDHQVQLHGGTLVSSWDVPEGLFPEGLIEAAFGAFVALLERLADAPDAWQEARFDLLPPDQAARRAAYNQTEGPRPRGRLTDGFRARVARDPGRVALLHPEGETSYGALAARADGLADALRRLGVEPGEPVAVCAPPGVAQVAAVLGALDAGAAYLPLSPEWPPSRRAEICAQAGVRVVLHGGGGAAQGWPEGLRLLDAREALAPAPGLRGPAPAAELAYVLHTSGSTGRPKGVAITHEAALNTIADLNARLGVGPEDRALAISDLTFDLSVYDLFGLLGAGGALVLVPDEDRRDPAAWAGLCRRHRVTLWNSAPALFELLVGVVERAAERPQDLRAVLLSADVLPLTLPPRARRLWPGARVINLGGATEAAIWSIAFPTEETPPGAPRVPYGRPLTNQRLYVLDRHLQPSPEGVPGELYIGGAGLAAGYWRDPERSAERFIVHPRTGERLYRTGDQGRFLAGGFIDFLGRLDGMVKVNGQRVELGEIEAALRALPGVRDAVAHAPGEPGRRRLVAFVVPLDPAAPPSPEALRRSLAERLPPSAVPGQLGLIDAVPLSANGKVDRARLPDPGAGPPQAPEAQDPDEAVRAVMEVVTALLPGLGVGPGDELVRRGASSVDLLQLATRLNERFGVRPPMAEVFRSGTPRALARLYREHGAASRPDEAPLLSDPAAREAHKALHLERPLLADDAVGLPGEPAPMRRYLDRASARAFDPAPLSLDELGRWLSVLWARDPGGAPRYLYGSPGGIYAVRALLIATEGAVGGLRGGAHVLDPLGRRLGWLGPRALPPEAHAPSNRPWVEQAPLTVALVAVRAAIEPLYGGLWRSLCLLEAGAMAQLLCEQAAAAGLGACQVGGIDPRAAALALGLPPGEELLHAVVAGRVRFEEDEI